jgi:7,8-dihydropterin-6-yl-methyl-4-(beta-D-ribofuranosyl)aminobenzene 5'-phosphate synthase
LETKKFVLKEASRIEIISLVDNSIDFLSSNSKREVQSLRQWTKERYGEEWAQTHTEFPVAEHGFSMLIRVFTEKSSYSVLFDTGVSPNGVVVNAERIRLDLGGIDYVVLSHWHYDHFGGLEATVKAINKTDLPIIAHERMFKRKGTANLEGVIRKHPEFPAKEHLNAAKIIITKKPYLIANKTACITGEIPRKTIFEKGFPQNIILVNNKWQPDPDILDERAMVLNLKEKGLIIISGCAHAGIINTIRYAQSISGVTNVYAVLGGFHLAGKEYEKRVDLTVNELKRVNPQLIVPSHCTGWRAATSIAQKLPDAFIWNSVGNLYQFNCDEKNNVRP